MLLSLVANRYKVMALKHCNAYSPVIYKLYTGLVHINFNDLAVFYKYMIMTNV